jgi:hypothetical protein
MDDNMKKRIPDMIFFSSLGLWILSFSITLISLYYYPTLIFESNVLLNLIFNGLGLILSIPFTVGAFLLANYLLRYSLLKIGNMNVYIIISLLSLFTYLNTLVNDYINLVGAL